MFGLERGFCLTVGGDVDVVDHLEPIFASLAPGVGSAPRTRGREGTPTPAERGYLHCGPVGSGHFVKMVHNGIEYALMASYAEGFNILKHAESGPAGYQIDVGEVAEVWRRGSVVSSWLLDLSAAALHADADLEGSDETGRRLGRGEMDRDRGDRVRHAGRGAHRRAVRPVLLTRRGIVREPGALGDAAGVRWPRGRLMVALEVIPDPEAAGQRAAEIVAELVRRAIADRGRFAWAISGGGPPASMFRRLGALELPWHVIDTWQVDERVAPIGDPERNRSEQERSLPPEAGAGTRWMPVEDDDLEAAAERYAATLPEWFDIVHMGIGADGHTASLVPGDPVLDVHDRDVAVTDRYEGRRRMTLTYPGLSRARSVLWLVTGSEKREALRRLLRADRSIPAARVPVADQVVVTDASAARDEGP